MTLKRLRVSQVAIKIERASEVPGVRMSGSGRVVEEAWKGSELG